ncbi:MAG: alkaline shock response membrane anchor protein AmaP [Caldiserica bacterium]|nr:alkaline shock response membrane anchor protein AmaP [Caldisericota bacterium]
MKAYTYFMAIVSTAILLALGVLAFLYTSNVLSPSIVNYFTGTGKWVLSIIGAVFILLALGEMYAGTKAMRQEPAVSFENPLGEVRISYSAMEDYIRRLVVQEIKGVKRVRAQVRESRGGVNVTVKAEVQDGQNIPRLTNGLQERVSSYLKDILGIASLAQVRVHITRISPPKEKEEVKEEVES